MMKKLLNKSLILGIASTLSLSSVSFAESKYYGNSARNRAPIEQPQGESPDILLKNGITSVVGFLRKSAATDLSQILNFIDSQISGYFDFKHMTLLAAGRHSRNMTQNELNILSKNIRKTFIESLAKNLVDYAYTNKKIKFLPPRRSRFGNEVTSTAVITHPRGYPTKISFRFHPTKSGWKVYDLSANGQSAIMHYRGQISRMNSAKKRQSSRSRNYRDYRNQRSRR
jgi:phospholipid transport system substrate-binding protein